MSIIWKKYSFVILFFTAIVLMAAYLAFQEGQEKNRFDTITVRQGETLWELADQYAEKAGMHRAEFVEKVRQENNLAGRMIKDGDSIVIPAPPESWHSGESQLAFSAKRK